MPQADDKLRAMFEDDAEAWRALGSNYYDKAGIITMVHKDIKPTKRQLNAIYYLCDEWDYGWEGYE